MLRVTGSLGRRLFFGSTLAVLIAADATAQSRTEVVRPVTGDPLASGDRLLERLARIVGPAADNPWLLKIEPGVYDLGGRSLAMRPFIDVEGSGEGVTTIRSTVDSSGTVVGADDAELRRVTVSNEAATRAFALVSSAPRFSVSHVTCVATGGSESSIAVANFTTAGGTFRDVTARAAGSPNATGVSSRGGLLERVHASAAASDIAYAVFNAVSSGQLVDVTAEATSDRFAGGIRNEGGAPLLRNVRVTSRGADIGDGIVNGASTGARVVGAVIHAVGGPGFANGIRHEFSSATTSGAEITVEGDTDAFGVSALFSGTPVLADVTIRVTAGGGAIGVLSSGAQVSIDRSTVTADGSSLVNRDSAASAIRAGATRLGGPVSAGPGVIRCVASYDSSTFAPLDASCSPMP